jgi:hypothetical protein
VVAQSKHLPSPQFLPHEGGLLRKKLLVRRVPDPPDLPLHIREAGHVVDAVTGVDAILAAVFFGTSV